MAAAVQAIRRKKRKKRQEEELEQRAREAFDKFDADRSGFIDREELAAVLKACAVTAEPAQVDSVLSKYVPSGQFAQLPYESFVKLVHELHDLQGRPSSPVTRLSRLTSRPPLKKMETDVALTRTKQRLPYQREVRELYLHPLSVGLVAAVIMANFFVNILEKEVDPSYPQHSASTWQARDTRRALDGADGAGMSAG